MTRPLYPPNQLNDSKKGSNGAAGFKLDLRGSRSGNLHSESGVGAGLARARAAAAAAARRPEPEPEHGEVVFNFF